ncbi:MAG: hypothetical protein ACK4SX_04845 [Alcanivoracaceae bacterium]
MSTLTLFPTQIITDTPTVSPAVASTPLARMDAGQARRLAPIRMFAAAGASFGLIHVVLVGSGFALEVVLGIEALSLAAAVLVASLADRVSTLALTTLNLLLVLALVHPATAAPAGSALMLQAAVLAWLAISRVTHVPVVWQADDFPQLKGTL